MGIFDKLKSFLGGDSGKSKTSATQAPLPPDDVGHGLEELSRRLAISIEEIQRVEIAYQSFQIPKRRGGQRTILAPAPPLKAMQRRIARRLLAKLAVHPGAMGFVRGCSIATHAGLHVGRAVVLKMDIRDFFPSTAAVRVTAYFRRIGWNAQVAKLLTRLCTHQGGLPQGAPTSPTLSNLLNHRLDARLTALAAHLSLQTPKRATDSAPIAPIKTGVYYSRYADDLTFSFEHDDHATIQMAIRLTQEAVAVEGYKLHTKKKLRIMRQHAQQRVTGLVVNERVNLPRETRRRLRAVEHHLQAGRPASLTPAQFQGWQALRQMVGAAQG